MKAWQYILAIIVLGLFAYLIWGRDEKPVPQPEVEVEESREAELDVENQTYEVEGEKFALVDGRATLQVPDIPGATNELSIFGEAVRGDLDSDGDQDAAVWLMNDPGGTGKFYYAAFVINDAGRSKTVPAYFLGDRIAPQNLSISGGIAVYSFADRKPDEPFTAEPTVAKSVEIRFDKKTNKIIE